MAENYFSEGSRLVKIGSPTKQSSNGRITFTISMPLTGKSLAGLPDWVMTGYDAVAKVFTDLSPEVQQVSGVLLAFSDKEQKSGLFQMPTAKLSGCELRGFKITRVGDPEDPDVELQFKAFGPFDRKFWAWLGEIAGQEVFMGFPSSLVKTPSHPAPSGRLPGTEDTDEDAEPPAASPKAASPAPARKNGPQLAADSGKATAAKPARKPN